MGNKVRLITPFLMLLAGALASVIMYIKKYDFNIDGIKFTDTMPFKIVWRPLDI